MESLLLIIDCKKFIISKPSLPNGATEIDKDRLELRKEKALELTKMCIDNNQITILDGIKNPLEAW